MLSTFPAVPCSDGLFGNQFPTIDAGFTPWDCQDSLFPFQQQQPIIFSDERPQEPVFSNSGSDNSNPLPICPNSASDRNNSGSGSEEPTRDGSAMDERKLRRMISNRLSARRSRMRKQKHLENLRNQVNRLKIGNRELVNRLRLVSHLCHHVQEQNKQLHSDSEVLRQKLWAFRQVLLVREIQQFSPSPWRCNAITPLDQQNLPP